MVTNRRTPQGDCITEARLKTNVLREHAKKAIEENVLTEKQSNISNTNTRRKIEAGKEEATKI